MNDYEATRLIYAYLHASEEQQKAALELMTEEERKAFLLCVGLMRIMEDKDYHDKIAGLVLQSLSDAL